MSTYEKRIQLSTLHLKDDPKRVQHIEEGNNQVKKPRFGLFSHLLPNCIGEDTYSRRPFTAIEPYNMKIGSCQFIIDNKGNCGEALFAKPGYCTINDFYKDPFRDKQQYLKEKVEKIPHSQQFKPSDSKKTQIAPWWNYIPPDYKKTSEKQKRNFYTNPGKAGRGNTTVGHLFSQFRHEEDPYERRKEFELKQQIEEKKKLLKAKPYSSVAFPKPCFTTDQEAYQINNPPKELSSDKFVSKYPPFKPANPPKKGYNMTINPFPIYEEDLLMAPYSAKDSRRQSQKQFPPWKPNSPGTFAQPHFALTNKSVKLNTEKFAQFKRAII